MKTCPKCGKQLEDKASFCIFCGAPLIEKAPSDGAETAEAEKKEDVNENASEEKAYQHEPYRQPYTPFDPADHTSDFDPEDIAENKLFASMPYFFSIIGIIVALMVPGSPFIRFHVKNEMRFLIVSVLSCIPLLVPVLGWAVGGILLTVIAALKILAIIWVLQGKAKDIPLIGSIDFLR